LRRRACNERTEGGRAPAQTIIYGVVLRVLLAPKPSVAWFLQPAERTWLQQRQDNVHLAAVSNSSGKGTTILGARTFETCEYAASAGGTLQRLRVSMHLPGKAPPSGRCALQGACHVCWRVSVLQRL